MARVGEGAVIQGSRHTAWSGKGEAGGMAGGMAKGILLVLEASTLPQRGKKKGTNVMVESHG